jgi:hypothetical protein
LPALSLLADGAAGAGRRRLPVRWSDPGGAGRFASEGAPRPAVSLRLAIMKRSERMGQASLRASERAAERAEKVRRKRAADGVWKVGDQLEVTRTGGPIRGRVVEVSPEGALLKARMDDGTDMEFPGGIGGLDRTERPHETAREYRNRLRKAAPAFVAVSHRAVPSAGQPRRDGTVPIEIEQAIAKAPRKPGQRFKSQGGAHYIVDPHGAVRRTDKKRGGKAAKRARRAAREAVSG